MDQVGCDHCLPSAAETAWARRRELAAVAAPIDEPHRITSILSCRICGQLFVSVFSETVDWEGGQDPQHWTLMPISADEADRMVARGTELTDQDLFGLEPRRSLVVEHPKDAPIRVRWGLGMHPPLGP